MRLRLTVAKSPSLFTMCNISPMLRGQAGSLTYRGPMSSIHVLRRIPPFVRFGVPNPMVIKRDQAQTKAVLDLPQLRQRQPAIIELTIEKSLHEEIMNQLAQAI